MTVKYDPETALPLRVSRAVRERLDAVRALAPAWVALSRNGAGHAAVLMGLDHLEAALRADPTAAARLLAEVNETPPSPPLTPTVRPSWPSPSPSHESPVSTSRRRVGGRETGVASIALAEALRGRIAASNVSAVARDLATTSGTIARVLRGGPVSRQTLHLFAAQLGVKGSP